MTLSSLRRRTPLRLAIASLATAAAAGLALVGAAPALAAASGTVHTDNGMTVAVRSAPSTGASATGSKSDGDAVSISCQTHGDSVTGKYGTSDVWDKIDGGYITDTYVYTGSDGTVAPDCGGGGGGTSCSTSGTGDPNSCAEAVSWANSHISTSDNEDYYNLCDHIVGLAYGFPHSGSTSAYSHWQAIPSSYKHAGDSNVPAGGLAFFSTSSGNGHVMISIGGGQFVSNDIHGRGTYTKTTISEIHSTWGATYLGWAQPWFQANH